MSKTSQTAGELLQQRIELQLELLSLSVTCLTGAAVSGPNQQRYAQIKQQLRAIDRLSAMLSPSAENA